MFRLRATLVAMTLVRPWRTGWSTDRGVDFSLAPTATPVIAQPAARADAATAERACFIDEDQVAPAEAAGTRPFVSPDAAAPGPGPVSEETPEPTGLRAWWSLSGKPFAT